jgi:hypothetical protein
MFAMRLVVEFWIERAWHFGPSDILSLSGLVTKYLKTIASS